MIKLIDILTELIKSGHYNDRKNNRIRDIINIEVPKEALGNFTMSQVYEPLKKHIQDVLYKKLASVEGSSRPKAKDRPIGYKFFIPVIQVGNKQYPITITTPPSEEDIKKGKTTPLKGTYYYYIVFNDELETLILSDKPDFQKVMKDFEQKKANKFGTFTRSVEGIELPDAVYPIDLEDIMGTKAKPEKEKPSQEQVPYNVRADYRKGADFEHEKFGKGKIVNTSAGTAGKGDLNGKLDWIEVDFGKPFVSGGKLQTVRRINNVYTKAYFDYPLE